MSDRNGKPMLPGCSVLPPLVPSDAAEIDDSGTTAKGRLTQRKAAGRFATLNAFIDATLRSLSRAEAAVWLVLYRDTKRDGLARTSQADLARRAGSDARTVRRALRKLQAAGLVAVVRRGGLRCGPSCYRIHPLKREG